MNASVNASVNGESKNVGSLVSSTATSIRSLRCNESTFLIISLLFSFSRKMMTGCVAVSCLYSRNGDHFNTLFYHLQHLKYHSDFVNCKKFDFSYVSSFLYLLFRFLNLLFLLIHCFDT